MKNNIIQHPNGNGNNPESNQPLTGLLSRKQVAEILGTCTHTIARNKTLVPIRFNRRLVRYRSEDVKELIASATTQ